VTTPVDDKSSSPGLPIEPVTLLIGLIRRWKIFLGIMMVSIALAVAVALMVGSQTFEAETIVLYKLPERKDDPGGRTPPVSTQAQMVKIPPNLRAVSEKLELGLTPADLDPAFQVRVEKKTSLLYITAQWDSAKLAAEMANTLRDVFLANQVESVTSGKAGGLNS